MVAMSEYTFYLLMHLDCGFSMYTQLMINSQFQMELGRHCTYCVVPGVRGVEQSRSMEAILQECIQLAESGYKEVTLLGQVRSRVE